MIPELKIQRDMVALEAFSVTDTGSYLRSIFPNIGKKLKEFSSSFVFSKEQVKLNATEKATLAKLDKINYLDIAYLTIQDTIGLNVHLPKFIDALGSLAEALSTIDEKIITPYSTLLGKTLTDAQHKFDTNSIFKSFSDYASNIEHCFKTVNGYIDARQAHAKSYSMLLDRNSDLAFSLTKIRTVGKSLDKLNRDKVEERIKEISTYIDLVLVKLNEGELDGVSPQMVSSLAEGAYQTANLLEIYSTAYYYYLTTETLLKSICDHIDALK